MADATIDSLSIQINTNSGNAVRGLNRISKALENLGKITESIKGLDGVNSFLGNLKELNGFTMNFNGLSKATNNLASANIRASRSYIDLWARLRIGYGVIRGISNTIGDFITKASDYTEDMNLFTVSMGKYAGEAFQYAKTVGDTMGIDEGKWARNQGIFMSMTTGFGVASDRAYEMSKNLTQLGYDYASFFNLTVDEAMQKLNSGLAGEIEPLRRLGVDLSQAKIEAIALSLGITKSFRAMNQAEKSQLRYYAMMTQLTHVQGDMARTLESPSNMLRVLRAEVEKAGRAIGQLFIPMLQTVLPYLIATARVVRDLAVSIASIVGIEIAEISSEGMGKLTDGTNEAKDSLDEASESANKFKNVILGFDELNVLTQNKDKSGLNDVNGGWLDFELPKYDFLSELTDNKVSQIVEDMKEWLGITGEITSWGDLFDTKLGKILKTVGAIAGAFLVIKFANSFTQTLGTLTGLLSVTKPLSILLAIGSVKLIWDAVEALFDDSPENDLLARVKLAVGAALLGAAIKIGKHASFGNILGFSVGLGLLVSSVMLLWDGIKMLTDSDPSNDLLGTVKTGVGVALMGASLGLMSGQGLGFALSLSLLFTSVYLMFTGMRYLGDDKHENDFIGILCNAFGGFLFGGAVQKAASHFGLTFSMPLAFTFTTLSLILSGTKLYENAKTVFDRLVAMIIQGIGLASIAKFAGLGATGMVLAFPVVLAIDLTLEWLLKNDGVERIKSAFESSASKMRMSAEDSIGDVISKWWDGLVEFGKKVITPKKHATGGTYNYGSISAYASGGFPEQGEFFIARENGAEMVGSIGNRTAVANNDQIVEAIERGVERAMGRSGNGGNWTIQIVDTDGNIKSETIISAAERRNRRDGKTVIPIGV